MINLLRAGFFRMKKSPVFWLGVVFMLGWAIIVCWRTWALQQEIGVFYRLDDVIFYHNLVVVFLPPVFCALFLGTEYDNGTVRNKLVAGCTRRQVYLSSLIVACGAVLIMTAVFLLITAAFGFLLLDGLAMAAKTAVLLVTGNLLTVTALGAVCTTASMLITKKATLAVVLIIGVIILLMVSMSIQNKLDEPEFYPMVTELIDGEFVQRENVPNPAHVSPGVAREVWQFIADFLPTGQALQYHFHSVIHPWRMCLYSVFIILASTGVGLASFRRKDIR